MSEPKEPKNTNLTLQFDVHKKVSNPVNEKELESLLINLGTTLTKLFADVDPQAIMPKIKKHQTDDVQATISLFKAALADFLENRKKISTIIEIYEKMKDKDQENRLNKPEEFAALLNYLCNDLTNILHVLDPEVLDNLQTTSLNSGNKQLTQLHDAIPDKEQLNNLLSAFTALATKANEYSKTLGSFDEAYAKTKALLQSLEVGSNEIKTRLDEANLTNRFNNK